MQIEYIAIKRLGLDNLEKRPQFGAEYTEMNLSPIYKYLYSDNKLCRLNKDFETQFFFGENINGLLAVIGENGSGKTRLIHDVILLLENEKNVNFKFIIILSDRNKYFYKTNVDSITFDFEIKQYKESLSEKFLKVIYSNVVDSNSTSLDGENILDLTKNTEVFSKDLDQNDLRYQNAFNQVKLVSEYNDLLDFSENDHVRIPEVINIFSNVKVLENTKYKYLENSTIHVNYAIEDNDVEQIKKIGNEEINKYTDSESINIPLGVITASYSRCVVKEFELRYQTQEELKISDFNKIQILKEIFDSVAEKVFLNIIDDIKRIFSVHGTDLNTYSIYLEENLFIDIKKFGEHFSVFMEDIKYLNDKFHEDEEAVLLEDFDEEEMGYFIEELRGAMRSPYTNVILENIDIKDNQEGLFEIQFKWEMDIKSYFIFFRAILLEIFRACLYTKSDFTMDQYDEFYSIEYENYLREEISREFQAEVEIEVVDEKSMEAFQINLLSEDLQRKINVIIMNNYNMITTRMDVVDDLIVHAKSTSDTNNFVNVEISVFSEEFENYLEIFGNNFDESLLLFSWRNMSSGEIANLNILSKIKELKTFIDERKKINQQQFRENSYEKERQLPYKTSVFFIDEGDLYLHPQWQKKFIQVFLKAINKILKEYKIYLILTTHSPFIISDIPQENLLLLRGENSPQFPFTEGTFGANINELLANQFFIQGGLVGQFAKTKINNVVNELMAARDLISLKEIYEKRSYYESFINIVAEPLVKINIIEIFNNKISEYEHKVNPLVTQIKEKEIELNKLKSLLEKNKNEEIDY